MKSRTLPSLGPALLLALAAAAGRAALAPTEWQHRQAVVVAAPGLVRVDLSPASFDAAGPQQEDLRLLDPSGQETAILVDRPPVPQARAFRPTTFETRLADGSTQVLVATGATEKLSSLLLETPSPFFLRAAKVEISQNNSDWAILDEGLPLFREWGAEKLDIPLGGRAAAYLRVTVADGRDAPVPFTGGRLLSVPDSAPAPIPVGARIVNRDEFSGETVLTVALDGRHVPLADITLDTKEPLFMRRITVSVREVRDALPSERTVGSGTLFRVALAGAAAREQTQAPLLFSPETRELLVHIHNGDSPPLAIDAVHLRRWPVALLFMAPAAGTYTLLSGNPQATAPHYDLAAFAGEMRGAGAASVVPGAVEDTPDYRPNASLGVPPMPDVPLAGAPLDTAGWAFLRPVKIDGPGVQELELDLEALARSSSTFADIRLMRGGNQIPYVLEQPGLFRSLSLAPEPAPDAKHASLSVWKLRLPKADLPLRSIVLSSTTPLFERQFRIYEKVAGQDGGSFDEALASGAWSRTPQPGMPETRVFDLPGRMRTDTLWIETDNGDNPAIALGDTQIVYPVVRLVFKVADADGFSLAYGNKEAGAPRYDLGLVASRLPTSSRSVAHLSADVQGAASRNPLAGISGGVVFWAALALVVAVLLVLVVKMFPKPLP